MKSIHSRFSLLSLFLLLLSFQLLSFQLQALDLSNPATALKNYIAHDDGVFSIQPIAAIPGPGYTAHLYNLTSQKWLTEAEVDKTLWTHTLVMIVPTTVRTTTALLYVGGDSNLDPLPGAKHPTVQVIAQIALASQSITAAVLQVPNQPITFAGQAPSGEDTLVAYTWRKALDTGNYIWPAYLPMTKSVIKAMDGIQQVTAGLGYTITDFVLTGFSKRGNAVWLTASVDPRVKAIAPGVIDNLNLAENFEHQYKSYGAYGDAIVDYVKLDIPDVIRAPEFRDLEKVIDPYASRAVLTMPKFLLNSSGDDFFLPDSSRFYFADLSGEKHIRFAPNTGHSLANSVTGVADTLYSLLGWYQTIIYNLPRPAINWAVDNGVLTASTNMPALQVRVWRANNPLARDFRRSVIGETWTSTNIKPNTNGEYTAALATGNAGYSAAYIEFVYLGLANLPVTYSTQIYVTPDVYPFTMTNPVIDPKPSYFWHQQIRNAQAGRRSEVSADTLNSYLPIPLFDSIIKNMTEMNNGFQIGYPYLKELAERECLATRLNISHGEMGWYSSLDLGWGMGNKLLWEHYKVADEAANDAFPWMSASICGKLNSF